METFEDTLRPTGEPNPAKVERLFNRIARRYDLTNRCLTLGIDLWWRRQLVAAVERCRPQEVVDLATGSGDVAFALRKRLSSEVSITGIDFCQALLDCADKRKAQRPNRASVTFLKADCLDLPLEDESVDVVTIAFGLRNFANRQQGLREMQRILRKPHGHLFILEFTQPATWLRPLYYFYLSYGLPALAGLITGAPSAYRYLTRSIKAFPDRVAMAAELRTEGFTSVSVTTFTGGIVALHEGAVGS